MRAALSEEYLSPAQVARILGIPTTTLRYWRQHETGPEWVKVGRLVRYPSEPFEKWLASIPRSRPRRRPARR